MHIEIHSRFEYHTLAAQFVEFGLEGYIAQGLLDEPSAQSLKALAELPGDATYDLPAIVGEHAQRGHDAGGGHTAQEAVLLHQSRVGTAARSRDGRYESGGAASANHHVVTGGKGCLTLENNSTHYLQKYEIYC